MSYEGYEQVMCENGHYFICDAYAVVSYPYGSSFVLAQVSCPSCKTPAIWSNSVDETNQENSGWVDVQPFKMREAVTCKCDLGFVHVMEPARYDVKALLDAQSKRMEMAYEDAGEIAPDQSMVNDDDWRWFNP